MFGSLGWFFIQMWSRFQNILREHYIFLLLLGFLMKTLIVMTELIFVHRTVTKGWIRQEISLGHYKHKPQPEKQNKNRTKLVLRSLVVQFSVPSNL